MATVTNAAAMSALLQPGAPCVPVAPVYHTTVGQLADQLRAFRAGRSTLRTEAVGTGLTRGFVFTRGALESYFGPGPGKRLLARAVNAGVWAAGATALYNVGHI